MPRIKEVSADKVTTEGDSVFQLVLFVLMGVALAIVLFLLVGRVFASDDKVYWCHCEPNGNCQTLHLPVQALKNAGHMSANGNPLHAGDHAGACVVPTATPVPPTATPSPTIVIPSPTINPCDGECVTPTPTELPDYCPNDEGYQPYGPCQEEVTPTPTRQPEVTPVPQGLTHTEGNQGTGLVDNSCHDLSVPEMPQDLWYTDYQVANGTASLVLHWGTNAQYGAVHIVYGEHIGQWSYAALNVPNNGQFTIGGLKPHQTYWFQVAYVRGCAVGQYSHPVDP